MIFTLCTRHADIDACKLDAMITFSLSIYAYIHNSMKNIILAKNCLTKCVQCLLAIARALGIQLFHFSSERALLAKNFCCRKPRARGAPFHSFQPASWCGRTRGIRNLYIIRDPPPGDDDGRNALCYSRARVNKSFNQKTFE